MFTHSFFGLICETQIWRPETPRRGAAWRLGASQSGLRFTHAFSGQRIRPAPGGGFHPPSPSEPTSGPSPQRSRPPRGGAGREVPGRGRALPRRPARLRSAPRLPAAPPCARRGSAQPRQSPAGRRKRLRGGGKEAEAGGGSGGGSWLRGRADEEGECGPLALPEATAPAGGRGEAGSLPPSSFASSRLAAPAACRGRGGGRTGCCSSPRRWPGLWPLGGAQEAPRHGGQRSSCSSSSPAAVGTGAAMPPGVGGEQSGLSAAGPGSLSPGQGLGAPPWTAPVLPAGPGLPLPFPSPSRRSTARSL